MASIGSIHAESLRRAAQQRTLAERDEVIRRQAEVIARVRVVAVEALVDAYRELSAARLDVIRLRANVAALEQGRF